MKTWKTSLVWFIESWVIHLFDSFKHGSHSCVFNWMSLYEWVIETREFMRIPLCYWVAWADIATVTKGGRTNGQLWSWIRCIRAGTHTSPQLFVRKRRITDQHSSSKWWVLMISIKLVDFRHTLNSRGKLGLVQSSLLQRKCNLK